MLCLSAETEAVRRDTPMCEERQTHSDRTLPGLTNPIRSDTRVMAISSLSLKRRLTCYRSSAFIRRTGRQGAILPWAAFREKPLTVFFLNARTPKKYSSALTAIPQEAKPVPDWHSQFQRDRRHSPCPGKERLERCSPSARGHSLPQIHSRDNHAARAAHCPACPHAPYGRCGADERGLVMVSVYSLWKADHHTGQHGEGKTYFAMRLAAACTNRKPLPGMETLEPFNIIYQTAEDGLGDTVKPRLMEAEADLERVLVIDDEDTPLTLADQRIARAIRENNARLVIIDPVQAFLGADVDMNRADEEIRPIFRSLGDIAQATGCAIVLIGHLNKAAGTQSTCPGDWGLSTLRRQSAVCCLLAS